MTDEELMVKVTASEAANWRTLLSLAGYWQEGSDQAVLLLQDEATRECIIRIGTRPARTYTGGSFAAALRKAADFAA